MLQTLLKCETKNKREIDFCRCDSCFMLMWQLSASYSSHVSVTKQSH